MTRSASNEAILSDGESLGAAELAALSLFSSLETSPDLHQWEGACSLMLVEAGFHYRLELTGAVYALTSDDLARLQKLWLADAEANYEKLLASGAPPVETASQQQAVEALMTGVSDSEERAWREREAADEGDVSPALICHIERPAAPPEEGILQRLWPFNRGAAPSQTEDSQIEVFGGDLCDCRIGDRQVRLEALLPGYLLHLPRRLQRAVLADFGYCRETGRLQVVARRLGQAPDFAGLEENELLRLAQQAKRVYAPPGGIVLDAGQRASAGYLIRCGAVEAAAGPGPLLRQKEVTDWRAFCRQLLQ